jgi:hypothetical protein
MAKLLPNILPKTKINLIIITLHIKNLTSLNNINPKYL